MIRYSSPHQSGKTAAQAAVLEACFERDLASLDAAAPPARPWSALACFLTGHGWIDVRRYYGDGGLAATVQQCGRCKATRRRRLRFGGRARP